MYSKEPNKHNTYNLFRTKIIKLRKYLCISLLEKRCPPQKLLFRLEKKYNKQSVSKEFINLGVNIYLALSE